MLDYFSHQKGSSLDKYSLEDFLFRWKKLQRVLIKENVDSLLLVTGLDSSDCVPSAYLFNWLFLGLSGKPVIINKYLDSIYNQIIVLFSANDQNENFIFLPPQAKANLEPLIYGIPNCRVFCPTKTEYQNKQLLDIQKITFFYEMVQKSKKIGIFLAENQAPKVIEKWPIIQSYALEPVGKTFFTLQFEVLNLGEKISALFKNLDNHTLKNLVGRTAYSLAGHVKGSTKTFELTNTNQRNSITESAIQQSLQQAVDIYAIQSGIETYKNFVNVLFGDRTGNNQLKSSKEVNIRSINALHATIQHFDPYTRMKVWRSYFLSTNLPVSEQINLLTEEQQETGITKSKYILQKNKNTSYSDGSIILSLYLSLVQGVLDSISTVSKDYKNLNKQFLTTSIFLKIKQAAESLYQTDSIIKQQHVEVEIESFDSFGEPRPIDFKDSITFKLTSTFYILKCRLNGVKSQDKSKNLGSLIFSECFLLQEGCYLLLTKNIPYFDFCECRQEEVSLLENLNPNYELAQLGQPLSNQGYKNRMFVPSEKLSSYHIYVPIQTVKCFFHQKGLRIFSDKFGWKILLYSQMKDLTMINKIPGQWVLMKINQPFLFAGLQTETLAMEFHGKAFEHLMNKVNSKEDPLSITFLEVIPPLLGQNWHFASQILKKQVKQGALMHQHQILQNEFLWSFIEAKQLMIINQMKDIKFNAFKGIYQQKITKQFQEGKRQQKQHNLLLINGTYGSNKLRLAQCLKRFGPSDVKIHIFNIPSDNLFNKIEVNTYISMVKQYIDQNQVPPKDDVVVIAVVPSWLDSQQLLNNLGDNFHIKCIVSTLNVSNFYSSKNFDLTENVLTFLLPGYSQHVVVDTYGEDESLTSSVMKVVWNLNKEAKVYRTTNSMMTTGQCKDIIQQSTYTSDYQKFLRSKYGAFFHFDQLKRLQINYKEFKVPIYFLAEIKKLSSSGGYLNDIEALVAEQLKDKREEAQNSKDQLMISLYAIEEAITVFKRKQKSMRIRSIKANLRVNEQEGIAHISWANQSYKQKIKPNESVGSLGIFLISQNYDELQLKKFLEGISYKKILNENSKPLITVTSLSEEEKKLIEKEGRDKYLDDGEFFDGYFYRDVEGHILQNHPNLDKLLKERVNEQNQRIVQDNKKIKEQWDSYVKGFN